MMSDVFLTCPELGCFGLGSRCQHATSTSWALPFGCKCTDICRMNSQLRLSRSPLCLSAMLLQKILFEEA